MKYIGGTALGLCALAVLFVAVPAHAETATTTSGLTSELKALLKQVSDLQAQLEKLHKQRAELGKQIIETRIALTKNLREGMTDEEVKVLQELLAADPTIYPEGLVTGYFGPLTTKALKRFQEKHGIEAVGEVGPKTLVKLNEEVSKGAWKAGNLPPGIAKKFSSTTAEMLPPGIYKKFVEQFWSKKEEAKKDKKGKEDDDDTATSTLAIDEIEVDDITDSSAVVSWETNEKTTGIVYYGTSTPLSISASSTLMKKSTTKQVEHSVTLTGLEEDEDYYFIIEAKNADGDKVKSSEDSFETDEEDEDDEDKDNEDDD